MERITLENFKMKLIYLILFLIISANAHSFTLNNTSTLVFGQNEVKVNVHQSTVALDRCTNIGIDESELLSIVGDAVDQYWNRSPTSRLKLRMGSVVTSSTAFATGLICLTGTSCDPTPALAVSSDVLITCNKNAGNYSGSGVLAVTVPNNVSGKTIVGSLIMINDQANNTFKTKSRDEKISIIAHELGHTFGLGHSPVKDSLMYYSTVNMRSALGSDDIDGISYLYPKQQPVTCGSVDMNGSKNNPNTWLGLLFGFLVIALINYQLRYLKLRPRF